MYQDIGKDSQKIQEQMQKNKTGISDSLKTSIQQYTKVSLDDVRVHYQSNRPKEFGALAYTQGNQVYIGPGQEKHLSHELGHVVQQKLGRVSANKIINGQPLNDSEQLEREADSFRRF